ncbi:L-rhamnose mutarotase [Enterococcus sp. PF1-24]|uniref:L-rhamnose mutarotase n=1 Tax=unclassified Enterococcus TaxID=2608891 RepID=UPI002474646B|nr:MULTISPECIES: L-rhamnose mutarotase [unclassified Enterococcus]MDH6364353.1 L-rhamnose mutarotase [Enterococcus sp. PFB1-1]MDH6401458.1 L-rhamnose mutarotase [Enterococcus sp. PF1-24]
MIKKAFRMKIYPDRHEEYKKRHDELWPEMRSLLKKHGAISYSIFLEPKTSQLFAYLEIEDEALWTQTAETEVNKKWWDYMADIMETNPDNSPVSIELSQVFEL